MEQGATLGRRVLSFASRRIAAAGEQQLMLGRKTAVERVASFLLRAARRNEDRGAPASPLTLAMTRNEIADHLGLTLETVSRGFSRLRQLGARSDEHTSELKSLMRNSYAVFCLKKHT